MKTIILYSLFLFSTISLFIACGSDDNITNNNPQNPSTDTVTLFTYDSLFLTDTSSSFKDSIEYSNTSSFDTLHVNFRIFAYRVDVNFDYFINSANYFHRSISTISSALDSSYSFSIPVNNFALPYINKFLILRGINQPNHLISIKNIKLWYIRRS